MLQLAQDERKDRTYHFLPNILRPSPAKEILNMRLLLNYFLLKILKTGLQVISNKWPFSS